MFTRDDAFPHTPPPHESVGGGWIDKQQGGKAIKIVKTGWTVSPEFTIHLHGRDIKLLFLIQSQFGSGTIRRTKSDESILFSVKSLADITNKIIPHFDKYPLLTQKRADFLLFKRVIELMNKKEHLTTVGLHEIVSIRAAMNNGLTELLIKSFPSITPVQRPLVEELEITQLVSWFH